MGRKKLKGFITHADWVLLRQELNKLVVDNIANISVSTMSRHASAAMFPISCLSALYFRGIDRTFTMSMRAVGATELSVTNWNDPEIDIRYSVTFEHPPHRDPPERFIDIYQLAKALKATEVHSYINTRGDHCNTLLMTGTWRGIRTMLIISQPQKVVRKQKAATTTKTKHHRRIVDLS